MLTFATLDKDFSPHTEASVHFGIVPTAKACTVHTVVLLRAENWT